MKIKNSYICDLKSYNTLYLQYKYSKKTTYKNCIKTFIYLALNLSNYENHLTKCQWN